MYKYFKKIDNTDHTSAWKSNWLSDNKLSPLLSYINTKIRIKFIENCLKQDKITFTHKSLVNIYIVYEINLWDCGYDDHITLENSSFGAAKVVKHADINMYKYSGYGIGFYRDGNVSIGHGFVKNLIFFGVDMSSSVHVDNKEKDILILGEGPTQGLDDTTWTAEKNYSINFTENNNKFCLRLHYNGANSYLFVNGVETIKFKINDSEIVATPLCLGKISKDISVDDVKKSGLNGHVYDVSVDYNAIVVYVLEIHEYLMKKHDIK